MGRYILKRLFEGVITLWLITLAVFFILRLGGGNPVEYMLPPEATQADSIPDTFITHFRHDFEVLSLFH